MIKNIQKYLLLHHPIIWNIRLIPMLLILAGVHLIFFGIGYLTSNTDFGTRYYYYNPVDDIGILYFVCALISVLILIGWLLFYNRNNGFKNFYPRTSNQLYFEWLLIFVITVAICLLPLTLTMGNVTHMRTVASKSECREALDLLNQVKILIPNDKSDYVYYPDEHKPIPIPKGTAIKVDTLDFDLYSFEYNQEGNITIKGYTGPSLYFSKSYYHHYYSSKYESFEKEAIRIQNQVEQVELVKQWLRQGDKEQIYGLMTDFMALVKKHNLKTNMTVDTWFGKVYNAPFFPVNSNTIISNTSDQDYYQDVTYYLPYEELQKGYNMVLSNHDDDRDTIRYVSLICLCIATSISLFVFSFRATNGRSWLINLVGSGVLIFISGLISIAIAEASSSGGNNAITTFSSFWLLIFAISLIYIIARVNDSGYKGISGIAVNMFLWLLPLVCPLICFFSVSLLDSHPDDILIEIGFWLSVILTIPVMWFVSILIRKWKSIPEE